MSSTEGPNLDHLRDVFLAEVGMTSGDAPQRIGPYLLVEKLGRGATGVVWRALHTELLEDVALKILDRDTVTVETAARFRREALLTARLRHPNVVRVRDAGTEGERSWIAMDLVPGSLLRPWFETRVDTCVRLTVVEKIARGVAAAHDAGIIHRDLKPENVIVRDDDEPIVLDFGLARQLGASDVSADGTAVGTPIAMAPEVIRGGPGSAASDVWALGVLLHEALTGHPPFEGSNAAEVWAHVLESEPARIPGRPGAVVARALAKEPAERHRSAGAFADDVAALRDGGPLAAASPLERWGRSPGMRRFLGIGALVLIAATAFGVLRANRRDAESAAVTLAAHDDLAARLHGALLDAANLRYSPNLENALLLEASIESTIDTADAPETVRAAWRAWMRFVIYDDDAPLDALLELRPDDVFVRTFAARRHLLRYAESAPWPETWVTLHAVGDPLHVVSGEETPARHELLESAIAEVRAALDARQTSRLGPAGLTRDLADAYGAYAAGHFVEAAIALDQLAGHADLTIEAWHLAVLARLRARDLDAASTTAERFVQRHPRLLLARRIAAQCRRIRAMVGLGANRPVLDDLLAARQHQIAAQPGAEAEGRLAEIDRMIGEARRRRGEEGVDDFRRAMSGYQAALDRAPRDARALASRAQCRLALIRPRERSLSALDASLEDLALAHTIEPDHPGIASAWLGVRIEQARLVSVQQAIPQTTWESIDADLAEVDDMPDLEKNYLSVTLKLARGEALVRRGQSGRQHFEDALTGTEKLIRNRPTFLEGRRLQLTAEALLIQDRASDPDPARAVVLTSRFVAMADEDPRFAWLRSAAAKWLSATLRKWARLPSPPDPASTLQAHRHAVVLWTACRDAHAAASVLEGRARALERLAHHPLCTRRPARLDEAIEAREALVSSRPDHIESYSVIGRLYAEMATLRDASPIPPEECLDEALEVLAEGIERRPRDIPCRLVRARIFIALNRPASAEADLSAAVNSDPTPTQQRDIAALREILTR